MEGGGNSAFFDNKPKTMKEITMEMLDSCLYVGLEEEKFWKMTFGEITRYIKARNKREEDNNKKEAINSYVLAQLIRDNVASLIDNNHKPREFMEIFGHLYGEEEKKEQEKVKEEQEASLQAEKFRMFAELQNRKRVK